MASPRAPSTHVSYQLCAGQSGDIDEALHSSYIQSFNEELLPWLLTGQLVPAEGGFFVLVWHTWRPRVLDNEFWNTVTKLVLSC